jgi:transcriptional regulator with XRE-family HTH domain
MFNIKEKIDNILKEKKLSRRKISVLLDCSHQALSQMILKECPFSPKVKRKLIPILQISEDEFESWIIASMYESELIKSAIMAIKNKTNEELYIFTQNKNEILLKKGLSRRALSRLIKYSPSGLNSMINGQIGVSKPVMVKISQILDIPLSELQAWALADKYSLGILLSALELQNQI